MSGGPTTSLDVGFQKPSLTTTYQAPLVVRSSKWTPSCEENVGFDIDNESICRRCNTRAISSSSTNISDHLGKKNEDLLVPLVKKAALLCFLAMSISFVSPPIHPALANTQQSSPSTTSTTAPVKTLSSRRTPQLTSEKEVLATAKKKAESAAMELSSARKTLGDAKSLGTNTKAKVASATKKVESARSALSLTNEKLSKERTKSRAKGKAYNTLVEKAEVAKSKLKGAIEVLDYAKNQEVTIAKYVARAVNDVSAADSARKSALRTVANASDSLEKATARLSKEKAEEQNLAEKALKSDNAKVGRKRDAAKRRAALDAIENKALAKRRSERLKKQKAIAQKVAKKRAQVHAKEAVATKAKARKQVATMRRQRQVAKKSRSGSSQLKRVRGKSNSRNVRTTITAGISQKPLGQAEEKLRTLEISKQTYDRSLSPGSRATRILEAEISNQRKEVQKLKSTTGILD